MSFTPWNVSNVVSNRWEFVSFACYEVKSFSKQEIY